MQILWTFSIYLEAVAILPQLVLLQRTQNIDNLTGNYVFLLGCARSPASCLVVHRRRKAQVVWLCSNIV